MAHNYIGTMLDAWDNHIIEHHPKITKKIPIPKEDISKLEALAEVYQLPMEDIIANLISNALKEVEERIPYVQGSTVIRIEEGDPIYDDSGHMPNYLQAKKKLEERAG
ncbi:MAG: hypothetical protein V7739_11725 [Motiliproteus sp.]